MGFHRTPCFTISTCTLVNDIADGIRFQSRWISSDRDPSSGNAQLEAKLESASVFDCNWRGVTESYRIIILACEWDKTSPNQLMKSGSKEV